MQNSYTIITDIMVYHLK